MPRSRTSSRKKRTGRVNPGTPTRLGSKVYVRRGTISGNDVELTMSQECLRPGDQILLAVNAANLEEVGRVEFLAAGGIGVSWEGTVSDGSVNAGDLILIPEGGRAIRSEGGAALGSGIIELV